MGLKTNGDVPGIPRRPAMSENASIEREKEAKAKAQESNRTSTGGTKKKDQAKKNKKPVGSNGGRKRESKKTDPKSKNTTTKRKDSANGEEKEDHPTETAIVGDKDACNEASAEEPVVLAADVAGHAKKKRKAKDNIPSDSVKRIGRKAGYNGKEGGLDHIGCLHLSMEQMRQYKIDSKKDRDYYMQAGRFLCGTRCHGCTKLASEIDMKDKDATSGAIIYYCDFGIQENKTCQWYCRHCFEEEAKKEAEAGRGQGNGRVRRGCNA